MAQTLRIFRRQTPVTVLGPGIRAAIWVQGCQFACPGCIVPESWPLEEGEIIPVTAMAEWVLAQPNIEGLTISGGEPMLQAEALVDLIRILHQTRDLSIMCYTGYRWEWLQAQGTLAQKTLLTQLDLLVDGTYQVDKHGDLRWRGSSNQRLIPLSDRHRACLGEVDCSAGMEVGMEEGRGVFVTGVPNQPGFRETLETLEQNLKQQGVNFSL